MAVWADLPLELRLLILGHIHESITSNPSHDLKHPFPQLSLVNREWNDYFSHYSFRLVVLDQDRLNDFAKYVGHNKPRQAYVQRIVLRIRLPEYDCTVCFQPEDSKTARRNDVIFMNTLRKFLIIMSTWEVTDAAPELDLGVYSPSDGQHSFRDCRLSPEFFYGADADVYERHTAALSSSNANKVNTCPHWELTRRGCPPAVGSAVRLHSVIGNSQSPHFEAVFDRSNFVSAHAIGKLSIRRQYYRAIEPKVLERLYLPDLQFVRHETWIHPFPGTHRASGFGLVRSLPLEASSVDLFCETNTKVPDSPFEIPDVDRILEQAAYMLAISSRHRFHISASFIIEAEHFLRFTSEGLLSYPNLISLSLTSRTLSRARMGRSPAAASDLLLEAATAAYVHMPKCRLLCVWYAESGHAFAAFFRRYCSADGPEDHYVLIESTWHTDVARDALCRELEEKWNEMHPSHQVLDFIHRRFKNVDAETWHPMNYRPLPHLLHEESSRQIGLETKLKRTNSSQT